MTGAVGFCPAKDIGAIEVYRYITVCRVRSTEGYCSRTADLGPQGGGSGMFTASLIRVGYGIQVVVFTPQRF